MDQEDGKIHKKTHKDFLKESKVVLVLLLTKRRIYYW